MSSLEVLRGKGELERPLGQRPSDRPRMQRIGFDLGGIALGLMAVALVAWLFHVAAQGKRAGLLKFQYEGHGVHTSAVKRRANPVSEPTPVSRIPSAISCVNQCGGMAAGGCYCDARCATNGAGCCADVATVCR